MVRIRKGKNMDGDKNKKVHEDEKGKKEKTGIVMWLRKIGSFGILDQFVFSGWQSSGGVLREMTSNGWLWKKKILR